jgi:predicted nucleic acid-binding protein
LNVYLDSSFVVSLYLTDTHSEEARRRAPHEAPFELTSFHLAEWTHALAQQEFRGNLNAEKAGQINGQFISDQASGLLQEVAVPEDAFNLCAELARRYGSRLGMRTLDSLHVACALELKAERFWTFDERQAKLAKTVGLKAV